MEKNMESLGHTFEWLAGRGTDLGNAMNVQWEAHHRPAGGGVACGERRRRCTSRGRVGPMGGGASRLWGEGRYEQ